MHAGVILTNYKPIARSGRLMLPQSSRRISFSTCDLVYLGVSLSSVLWANILRNFGLGLEFGWLVRLSVHLPGQHFKKLKGSDWSVPACY